MFTEARGPSSRIELLKSRILLSSVLAGVGAGNFVGAPIEIGPVQATSQITVGSDTTFGIGDENLKIDTGLPFHIGLHIEPKTMTGDTQDHIPQLADPEALSTIALHDTLRHLGTAGIWGGLFGLLLVPAYRRRSDLIIGASLGVCTASLVLPSAQLMSLPWEKIDLPKGIVDTAPDISVSGTLLTSAAASLKQNEVFYDTVATGLAAALELIKDDPVTTDLTAVIAQTDQHCNIGAARLTKVLANGTGAELVIQAGDYTTSGWDIERMCIEVQRLYNPESAVGVIGNHDSNDTAHQLKDTGVNVLDHSAVTIDGMTYYGAPDPMRSVLGQPTTLRDKQESQDSFMTRLERNVCDYKPNVLIVHNPRFAQAASRCADITIAGHMHAETPPVRTDNDSFMITLANSGGSAENTQSVIGKFGDTSTSYILYIDTDQPKSRYVGMRRVTISPAGKVAVSEYIPFPETISRQHTQRPDVG